MEIKELLTGRSASLIDVRTRAEYAEDHLPNAINIPLDQIANRIQEFKHMGLPIVTYCRSGNRSEMAKNILQLNGINDVINGGSISDLKQSIRA